MNRLQAIAVVSISLFATDLAHAQSGSISEADKTFLMEDSRGAAYELASAKLAVSKATRDDVKNYTEKLVRDHERYNSELEQLGRSLGLTLSTELDQTAKVHIEDLQGLSGTAFDMLFLKEAKRVNADDKRDADKEKASTKEQTIKDFIAKFAATDAEHEKIADELASKG